MTTSASTTTVRYPLIVVDWSRDRDRFGSGWLRLLQPGEIAAISITPSVQIWDADGRPACPNGAEVALTSMLPDPRAREVLLEWRTRAPVPMRAIGRSGETAVLFLVDDVMAAGSRLADDGSTKRRPTWLRLLPVWGMLLAAVLLIPLARLETWGIGLVAAMYGISAIGIRRWSAPRSHWGDPPRTDPPDAVSHAASATVAVFWGVAAAAATLTILDWSELVPGFVPWA